MEIRLLLGGNISEVRPLGWPRGVNRAVVRLLYYPQQQFSATYQQIGFSDQ